MNHFALGREAIEQRPANLVVGVSPEFGAREAGHGVARLAAAMGLQGYRRQRRGGGRGGGRKQGCVAAGKKSSARQRGARIPTPRTRRSSPPEKRTHSRERCACPGGFGEGGQGEPKAGQAGQGVRGERALTGLIFPREMDGCARSDRGRGARQWARGEAAKRARHRQCHAWHRGGTGGQDGQPEGAGRGLSRSSQHPRLSALPPKPVQAQGLRGRSLPRSTITGGSSLHGRRHGRRHGVLPNAAVR